MRFFLIAGSRDSVLCVVETPLKTPYFTSIVQMPTECYGCAWVSSVTAAPVAKRHSIEQVHIVIVDDPEGGAVDVVTKIENPEGTSLENVALVLHSTRSPAPVVFTVAAQGAANSLQHLLLVIGGNEVRGNNVQYRIAHHPQVPEEDLIEFVNEEFGFITSLTRAPTANKLEIDLDSKVIENSEKFGCDANVSAASLVSKCFTSIEQPVEGCFHYNMLGVNSNDIHIIQLNGSSDASNNIILAVVGGSERNANSVVERNLTLVLQASRPTTWDLHAENLHGTITLLVGGGGQVENTSVSGTGLQVKVRKFEAPAMFDQLILKVLTNIGPPVSYTHTTNPNKISFKVPPKRVMEPEFGADDVHYMQPLPRNPFLPEGPLAPTATTEDALSLVQKALTVECQNNIMTVSISRAVMLLLDGLSMALVDPSCRATTNQTHFILTSPYGQCGASARQDSPYRTTYINYVHLDLGPSVSDDEDFDGSGYGVDEHYDPHIKPIPVKCHATTTPEPNNSTPRESGADFHMEVFRDSDYKSPIHEDDYPTTVQVNQWLYVKNSMKNVLPWASAYSADLKVVLEECWLSNSSLPTVEGGARKTLVRKSCAAAPSVDLSSPTLSDEPKFGFKVLPEYVTLSPVYLHCLLGICSADSLPRPAVNRCTDPSSYCNKEVLMRVFLNQPVSSSPKTLSLGPITLVSSTNAALSVNGGMGHGNGKDDNTQIIVLGGLSTEIVVGIALASFVIGVCLTATLWIIHMKTDPHRQKRPEGSAPRNSGYDLSAHSGSSTPSSQAPMTHP
ncbi:transforming growth factor beta receptor type 3-like [Oratosquilla oratoria]|uniref:transforming growth factor beta receptor type 3-like n=1 Tax=Oratosquilla oratoria TaxID=337810 RepID=UPI003F75EA32